jgi:hypothetical protein
MIAEARVPIARMTRTRRAWMPVFGWTLLAVAAALTTRSGADHVLRGTFGFVVLPLVAYGVVAGALGGAGLKASVRPLVLLGAKAPRAATAAIGVSCIFSALICAALGAVVCLLAHRAGDPPVATDALATAGISALGGAAYAAYFCAGSAIGKGSMRGLFLALDWLMGSGGGFGAIFVPRGHVLSLLGGAQAFEISSKASSLLLMGLVVAYGALAVQLGRRA